MRSARARIILSAVVAVAATGCGDGAPGASAEGDPIAAGFTIQTDSGPVRSSRLLGLARTPAQRRLGLMGRRSLAPDGGMVFLFDEPTRGGFWMKDTLIPLSIAFWDEEGEIVDVLEMEPCRSDPCPLYTPRAPYVGAVEMNRGWFDRRGVEVGDRIDVELYTY